MDGTRKRVRALALGVAALAAVSMVAAVPSGQVAAASATACRVKDVETRRTYGSLQKAVKAAKARHHLAVRGTCHGRTEISKDLTIKGSRTKRSGAPTLDADSKGTVLTVGRGTTVTVVALTIREGKTTRDGGGIMNRGALTLFSVVVHHNRALNGGGVWSDPHGTLVLDGNTVIKQNVADVGGGIRVAGSLVVRGKAQVSANTAISGAGVAVEPVFDGTIGRVSLEDNARISGNTASYMGGGVFVSIASTLTLEDDASIVGNTAERGGGVFNAGGPVTDPGRVTLNASSTISGNVAGYGGGVYNSDRGELTLNGSSAIKSNAATETGGGVLDVGNLTMAGTSVISANEAAKPGGGLYVADASESVLSGVRCGPSGDANVRDNDPDDCHIDSM